MIQNQIRIRNDRIMKRKRREGIKANNSRKMERKRKSEENRKREKEKEGEGYDITGCAYKCMCA